MTDEAKAVQEIAKAAAKGIDAAREAGGFLAQYLHAPLEVASAIWTDRLKYMRWERQQRFIARAKDFLKEIGSNEPTRVIPLKNALPLIQAAVLEEDDYLQDEWAKLLVNAADALGPDVQRAHIEILSQLTPVEARILEVIYALPFEATQHNGAYTAGLPNSAEAVVPDATREERGVTPSEEICVALGNLARLGCLRLSTSWGGGEHFYKVLPTMLGRSFVRACTLRQAT
ncbi:DUF4393 domain-containing protein [Ramlibacter aquaticus]|uniref:DUF4393 domain-containing protein n=1 Tax=Ramlibacter aquaticus TaxID=2780094 RepID=A0ABR9SD51_9BURK|nr:Abi-alpha family protein [Ramlibacter aquaticus]MBE7939662.1 DUF4393 domain-containing protein [Ramlibacter aquaticus]